MLEEPSIHPEDWSSDEMDGSLVSFAPSLRILCSPDINFRLSGKSAVVSATFSVYPRIVDMFLNSLGCMPYLSTLTVDLELDGESVPPPAHPIVLSSLKTLRLRGGPYMCTDFLSLSISAPETSRLNLLTDNLHSSPESLDTFVLAFPNIRYLEIDSKRRNHYFHEVPAFELFTRIQTLTLDNWDLPGKFFVWINRSGDVASGRLLLPGLEALIIRTPLAKSNGFPLQEIAHFARTRAGACRGREKLFRVSLEAWPSRFPGWFRAALGAVLGPSNVRLTSSDGIIYDAV
ncbi:hypothetical protein AURDEDRAFT_159747 [Auricularia subglabra TFB-10046 SS5]|nr:hypothetical protein AURDEDRAFT_159747 [Auricularia subglabra TFB-10046 SS5]